MCCFKNVRTFLTEIFFLLLFYSCVVGKINSTRQFFGAFVIPFFSVLSLLSIIITKFVCRFHFKGETFPLSFHILRTSQLKPCHSPLGSLKRALQRLWRVWRRMWHTWRSWNHLKARNVKRLIFLHQHFNANVLANCALTQSQKNSLFFL